MPGSIAQLVTPGSSGFFGLAIPPFTNYVYLLNNNTICRFDYTMVTQSPGAVGTIPVPRTVTAWATDVTGDVFLAQEPGNSAIYLRFDGTTLALLGTWGVSTGFPNYPTTYVAAQGIRCPSVFPASVTPGVGNASLAVGYLVSVTYFASVEVFFTNPFRPAGFGGSSYPPADANQFCVTCFGDTFGHVGSVFFAYGSTTTGTHPSAIIHKVTINAGAETYNISSWPTPNPHITAAPIGTLHASDIVPGAAFISIESMGITDGSASLLVYAAIGATGIDPARQVYLVKIRTADASVVWAVPALNTGTDLGRSSLGASVLTLPSHAWRITNVATGASTDYPLTGLAPTAGFVIGVRDASDDATHRIILNGAFTRDATSPVPVDGTPDHFSGWALVEYDPAGVIITPRPSSLAMDNLLVINATHVQTVGSQIFLECSDDRGHSFGSPVGQPLGPTGNYSNSVQWQRLGYARDRVFRITWSTPAATALQGAWITVDDSAKS